MRKLIFNDSFDYPEAEYLVKIIDNPDERRKVASSVRDSWGEIEPIKNHAIIHLIALGSFEKTGSNLNFDAFEEEVCKKSHPTFVKKAKLYRHHNSKVPHEQRDGDVIRSAYNEKMGRVELAIAANIDKCADWLGRVERGGDVKFSMGWHCENDICSICGNVSKSPSDYCIHVKKAAPHPYGRNKILPDGRKCFVFNRDGYWNDISFVDRGADMIAMDLAKIAGIDTTEPFGGAELAELFENRVLSTPKLAIAEKLSKIQKYIDAMGVNAPKNVLDKVDLSDSAIRELQNKKPKDMFGSLAKTGTILPFRLFFKIATGSRYNDFLDIINETENVLSDCIKIELDNASNLESISSIHDYDSSKTGNFSLTQNTLSELTKLSAAPLFQDERVKNAVLDNEPINERKSFIKPESRAMVRQYLAYKIAALNDLSADDDTIFNTFILN
jgi:hypothetical protein